MGHSKMLDNLDHELFDHNTYGSGKVINNLFIKSLGKSIDITLVGTSFSFWKEILQRVSQKKFIGPLLFNKCLNSLIYAHSYSIYISIA